MRKVWLITISLMFLICNNTIAKTIDALSILSFEVSDTTKITVRPHKEADTQIYTAVFEDKENIFLGEFHIQNFSGYKDELSWYSLESYKNIIAGFYPSIIWVSVERTNINGKQVDVYIFDYTSKKQKTARFKFCVLIYNNYLVRCYSLAPVDKFERMSKMLDSLIGSVKFTKN